MVSPNGVISLLVSDLKDKQNTVSKPPSVTQQFTQGMVQAARRAGIQLPEALRQRLADAGRTPLALQDELWEAYCEAAADPLAGLKLGLSLHVGHLDLVGMLLMSCETLGEAMELLVEYHPIVGEGGDFRLQATPEQCLLVYRPRYQNRRRERVEAVLACVLNMARWVTGGAFEARELQFAGAPGATPQAYRELLGAPVRFDSGLDGIAFAPAQRQRVLIQANATLRDHLLRLAEDTLAGLDSAGVGAQVQQLIRDHPRWGKERVAEQLGISGRHLVRKLQEEGTSFRLLRAGVLQQLAEQHLRAGTSVARCGELLGFSDESAFVKAFKRWSGATPSQYRHSS